MKPITKQIEVSSCYHIDRYSKNMEATAALHTMYSNEAGFYDSATRQQDFSVTLTRSNLICPYCQHTHPLKTHNAVRNSDLEVLKQWADPQLSLLEQSIETITFFKTHIKAFLCPHCGYSSNNQGSATAITTTSQKNKILILSEVKDLFQILSLPHMPKSIFHFVFPLYEQIEFHLSKGRICIRIINGNEEILRTVDISNTPHSLSECVISDWFYKIVDLRTIIIEAFRNAAQKEVPFDAENVTLEDLFFFTRFVGYNKAFYNAIPYEKETLMLDKSFKHLRKLHTQKSAKEYVFSFKFSKFKSLRKQIFEKTELLFYLPECESLFAAIGDVNVFRRILQCEYALDLLLTLHQHPIFIDFLQDYCRAKGAARIYDTICARSGPWHDLRTYLFYYCSLSQYSKTREKKKWNRKSDFLDSFRPHTCSLPILQEPPKYANCVINAFTFKHLRNTAECFKAGKALKNCLKSRDCFDSAIVTVSNDGEIVAAISVWGNSISQAYSYENNSIESVPGLAETIAEWAKQNGLVFDADLDEFIEFIEE